MAPHPINQPPANRTPGDKDARAASTDATSAFGRSAVVSSDSGAEMASPCGACPIRGLSVCSVLDTHEINCLAEIVQTLRFKAGASIFDEGENATALFNVTSGTVKLYKLMPDGRRQVTGFLFAGDFLGLAVNDCYAYSAEAVCESYLCRFPRPRFESLMSDFPHFQRRLFSMTANELALAQDQMLLLGRKSAREKIASFLLSLSGRAVRRGQPASPIPLPMGRADIADFLGLTTETVSRTLTSLKSSGIIRLVDGNRVELTDRDGLEDLAEGL